MPGGDQSPVRDGVAEGSTTLVKSYRYLRSAMVGLVVALGVAVVDQSLQQGFILSSISAYYYTPAQAVFVGVLIAIGVCMVALKGTTEAEDILLNLGGMLAPVVAIVPTPRGTDYATALRACRAGGGSADGGGGVAARDDCPTVLALRAATEANVANNMLALLVVVGLGILAALLFRLLDRNTAESRRTGVMVRLGLLASLAVYALGAWAFWREREAFIDYAHYAAAVPLFVCIVAVALVNALRHRRTDLQSVPGWWGKLVAGLRVLASTDRYSVIALVMLLTLVIGTPLAVAEVYQDTVFWLEATLITLFALFWVIQTAERWHEGEPASGRG